MGAFEEMGEVLMSHIGEGFASKSPISTFITNNFIWLSVPFCTIISWVFHAMDLVGVLSENPFEGTPNDIPITALSRTIEIDIRQLLEETDLPEPIGPFSEWKILS